MIACGSAWRSHKTPLDRMDRIGVGKHFRELGSGAGPLVAGNPAPPTQPPPHRSLADPGDPGDPTGFLACFQRSADRIDDPPRFLACFRRSPDRVPSWGLQRPKCAICLDSCSRCCLMAHRPVAQQAPGSKDGPIWPYDFTKCETAGAGWPRSAQVARRGATGLRTIRAVVAARWHMGPAALDGVGRRQPPRPPPNHP